MKIFTDLRRSDAIALTDNSLTNVRANLAGIKSIIALSSLRGGVGKSALAVNLAAALAQMGRKTAIVDADLNAPSVRGMLGMKAPRRLPLVEWIEPSAGPLGLRIVGAEVSFQPDAPLLSFDDSGGAAAVADNGAEPLEAGYSTTLLQMFAQTRFGPADVMLIDLAPGLESCLRILEVVREAGLVLVSHPSHLAAQAAERMLHFAALKKAPVLGIVENMVGFNCGGCHVVRPLMPHGAVAGAAREAGIAVLDRLPFDPRLAESNDRGVIFVREYADAPLAKQIVALAQGIERAANAIKSTELSAH